MSIQKHQNTYSYLTDPHLFYHLESPVKISQLLQSGLYELDANSLVEKESQNRLKISEYTLNKIPFEIK